MSTIDPFFADEIKKYGADDFNSCFNCGNCTAVCSLSEKSSSFPRMMIRYGMLGLKEDILSSKELWLCYSCGDCSDTCPRQAEPGNYMAALRRYAIAHYEPTGITRFLFKSNPFAIVFTLFVAAVLAAFLFTLKPELEVARWLFELLPYDVIHNLGIAIFILTGISAMIGITAMVRNLSRGDEKSEKKKNAPVNALKEVINELFTMKRYASCDKEEDSHWEKKHTLLKPWFVHWSIMWGFIGLLVATILDFLFKDPATDIWWPSRILGTIAGILMVYGSTIALIYRIKKVTKAYATTSLSDWFFLTFLWLAGITGFWLEIAVAFEANHQLNHIIFLIHTIISMELVLLFAFSKFAHAMYRPVALFYHFRNQ